MKTVRDVWREWRDHHERSADWAAKMLKESLHDARHAAEFLRQHNHHRREAEICQRALREMSHGH